MLHYFLTATTLFHRPGDWFTCVLLHTINYFITLAKKDSRNRVKPHLLLHPFIESRTNQSGTYRSHTTRACCSSRSSSTCLLQSVPKTRKQHSQASYWSLVHPPSPLYRSADIYFYNLFSVFPRSGYLAQILYTPNRYRLPFGRVQCSGLGRCLNYTRLGFHIALEERKFDKIVITVFYLRTRETATAVFEAGGGGRLMVAGNRRMNFPPSPTLSRPPLRASLSFSHFSPLPSQFCQASVLR